MPCYKGCHKVYIIRQNTVFYTILFLILHSISIYTLVVWMSGCLYPTNAKTAEPIDPKFCKETHMTQE